MAVITKQRSLFTVLHKEVGKDGEVKVIKEVFDNYNDALQYKDLIESQITFNKLFVDDSTNIIQFLYDYASIIGKDKWSLSIYDANMRCIRTYISDIFKNLRIKDINLDNAQTYISRLENHPGIGGRHQKVPELIPPSAIKRIMTLLRQSFNYLVSNSIIGTNPFSSVIITRKETKKISPEWREQDVIELFDQCNDERLFIFLHLYFALDLEIAEVMGLSWNDLEIDERNGIFKLTTNKMLTRLNKVMMDAVDANRIITSYPRRADNDNKSSIVYLRNDDNVKQRDIPIRIVQLLNKWKQITNERYQPNANNLIIHLENGRPYDQDYMKICFKKLVKKCSFDNLTLVKFRKYAASINGHGISNSLTYYDSLSSQIEIPHMIYEGVHKYNKMKKMIPESKVLSLLPDTKQTKEVKQLIRMLDSNEELKNEIIEKLTVG